MTFALADRVQETTLTTGTGALTLAGAIFGYQSFATALASGSTCDYSIIDPVTGNWEVGVGAFTTPATLSRDSVLSSSNSNALVNFAAGTKYVSVVASANYIAGLDNSTAVALAPITSARNVVQGTGDIVGLTLKATAAQSAADIFEIKDSGGNNLWVVGPTGAIAYGVAADSRFFLFVGPTVVPVAAEVYQGVRSNIKVQPTTNTTAQAWGTIHNPESGGTGNISSLIAVEGDTDVKGTGTVTLAEGGTFLVESRAAGPITTAYGVQAVVKHQTGSTAASIMSTAIAGRFAIGLEAGAGLITNAYGVYVAILTGGSGSVTNSYGLYIDAITNGGTLNYAVYTNAGIVRLGGNLLLNAGIVYPGSDSTTAIRVMKADAATAVLTVDTTNSVIIAPKIKLSSGVAFPSSDSTTAIILAKSDGTTAVLTVDTTNSIVIVPKLQLTASVIYPSANSTTAIQFMKADGTTAVMTLDTTSSFVSLNAAELRLDNNKSLYWKDNTGTYQSVFIVDSNNDMIFQNAHAYQMRNATLTLNMLTAATGVSLALAVTTPAHSGTLFLETGGNINIRGDSAARLMVLTQNGHAIFMKSQNLDLAQLAAIPDATTTIGILVRGIASQSAALQKWQLTGAVDVGSVDNIGIATHAPQDAGTNTVLNALVVGHDTTGTVAASYGTAIDIQGRSNNTAARDMSRLRTFWITATDASRAARAVWSAFDTAERDVINIEASGSAGKLGFFSTAPVVLQTDGAALTNSVTAGGTTDTIANYTDLSVYANDAAAIRNDIYQLARKMKIVDDALRAYGLLT